MLDKFCDLVRSEIIVNVTGKHLLIVRTCPLACLAGVAFTAVMLRLGHDFTL